MSASVLIPPTPAGPSGEPADAAPAPRSRQRVRLGDRLLHAYTWLLIIWLALTIAAVALFIFNNPSGRRNIRAFMIAS